MIYYELIWPISPCNCKKLLIKYNQLQIKILNLTHVIQQEINNESQKKEDRYQEILLYLLPNTLNKLVFYREKLEMLQKKKEYIMMTNSFNYVLI